MHRPNVLWLVSEDNSPQFVGPYGDPLANTPTIDQLARDDLPQLVEWLHDDVEPVRWWAALRCVMLQGAAAREMRCLRDWATRRPKSKWWPPWCGLGATEQGSPVLTNLTMNHPSAAVRLQAINALECVLACDAVPASPDEDLTPVSFRQPATRTGMSPGLAGTRRAWPSNTPAPVPGAAVASRRSRRKPALR